MISRSASARTVCVVIVNWNGWRDTVQCLGSLFELRGLPLHVVVCDNASTDGSAGQLSGWLRTQLGVSGLGVRGKGAEGVGTAFDPSDAHGGNVRTVHLLCLAENFGYAGALNRGITWGQEHFGARSFWLLNNDVRAEPDALARLTDAHDALPNAGLCGSVLMEWDQPSRVQAIGGIYTKALAVGSHLRELPRQCAFDSDFLLDIDYPVGASLFVEQDYLDKVGLMDESYFLYYEEMDWAERGRRQGFRPVVALKSRLFHKEGASTGSHGGVRRLSKLSERHGVINRLRITRKFWPGYLPLVWLSLVGVVLDRLVHGEVSRARLVLRLMFSPSLWLRAKSRPAMGQGPTQWPPSQPRPPS